MKTEENADGSPRAPPYCSVEVLLLSAATAAVISTNIHLGVMEGSLIVTLVLYCNWPGTRWVNAIESTGYKVFTQGEVLSALIPAWPCAPVWCPCVVSLSCTLCFTPPQCSCVVHLSSIPMWCPCIVHLCCTPVWYSYAVLLYFTLWGAPGLYTRTLPSKWCPSGVAYLVSQRLVFAGDGFAGRICSWKYLLGSENRNGSSSRKQVISCIDHLTQVAHCLAASVFIAAAIRARSPLISTSELTSLCLGWSHSMTYLLELSGHPYQSCVLQELVVSMIRRENRRDFS